MLMPHQSVIETSDSPITYCITCRISYNKLNKNDIQMHKKLHKPEKVEGIELAPMIHQSGNRILYGKKYVQGYLILKENVIVSGEYDSFKIKSKLINFVNKNIIIIKK